MQRLFRWILLAGITLVINGCAVLENTVQKPAVSIKSVNFRPGTLQEGTLDSQIEISNPNGFSLPIKRMLYSLKLNDREFANSTLSLDRNIPAHGSVQVALPIKFRYAELVGGLTGVLSSKRIRFQLSGNVDFGLLSVPYSKTGEFNLR